MIQRSSPDTEVTVYQVDAAGNRTRRTDAAGNMVQMRYCALGGIGSILQQVGGEVVARHVALLRGEVMAQGGNPLLDFFRESIV